MAIHVVEKNLPGITPKRLAFAQCLAIAIVLTVVATGHAASAQPILYGARHDPEQVNNFVQFRGPSTLYTLDPMARSARAVGPIGFDDVTSMDFHPLSGVLYAAARLPGSGSGASRVLITIDLETGAGTEVTLLGTASPNVNIAFRPDGELVVGQGSFAASRDISPDGVSYSGDVEAGFGSSNPATGERTEALLCRGISEAFSCMELGLESGEVVSSLSLHPESGAVYGLADLRYVRGADGWITETFVRYLHQTLVTIHPPSGVLRGDWQLSGFGGLAWSQGTEVTANTQPGSGVMVTVSPATVTFTNVQSAGDTTVSMSTEGTPPPSGFQLGNPPAYYDVATTAAYTGRVTVCITYDESAFQDESLLQLNHFEPPVWVNRTVSLDTDSNVICAQTDSLSPFAIFEPADTTPPLIAGSPAPFANDRGWNNSAVNVRWSVTDAESGIAGSTGCESVTLTSETEGTTITCTATNGAGLTAIESVTIRIDRTPPLVNALAPWYGAEYLLDQELDISYECVDALSGLASCAGLLPSGAPLPTGVAGPANFAIAAADIAGNTAAASIGYAVRYGFTGFLPPLENLPAINVMNAGRTIPVKWRLTNAQGAVISDTESFVSLSSLPIDCDASSTAIPPEAATGKLQYDPQDSHFTFTWKTDSRWTGCRLFQVDLADGTSHVAKAQMK
jgi:hypothetical protein